MSDVPPRLILFDGICAVCDAGMTWIMDHDPDGRFAYAPLQGPTAAAILDRHPELPEGLDSIVYVDRTGGGEVLSWRTDALLDVMADLPAPWRWATALRWVPRPVRDAAYDAFAAVRYRVFGTLDRCRMPDEVLVGRLLP